MEPHRNEEQLAADLRALRPTPRPEFAAELDERAAAGFPRRSRLLPKGPPDLFTAMRGKGPAHLRRLLIPAGGVAVIAIAIATAVTVSGESEHRIRSQSGNAPGFDAGGGTAQSAVPHAKSPARLQGAAEEAEPLSSQPSDAASAASSEAVIPRALEYGAPERASGIVRASGPVQTQNRAVERNAELVLAAAPADVGDDSAEIFEAVHAHDGIVLRSSTREGDPGVAGARFELLIPSAKLGDALAALSGVDEVRSRHEATNDITAPTVTTGELLRDSKARVDSLLAQLAAAETGSEREAVEAELRQERRHRARLRAQLQHLERRADFSRVLVRIETGASDQPSEGGAWGVGDALDDAGQILAVAAAVSVVALAILGPIALIALLAWLAHRAWVRRERRRVLS
ncbi:MAG TPA: DUF4349 domain-containing protein [Solirubrobacterales bacterium]|nr:DUF4349 domain-containing protein [Solirubrobacterales bacterium]